VSVVVRTNIRTLCRIPEECAIRVAEQFVLAVSAAGDRIHVAELTVSVVRVAAGAACGPLVMLPAAVGGVQISADSEGSLVEIAALTSVIDRMLGAFVQARQ
jgi:hypothetical protein